MFSRLKGIRKSKWGTSPELSLLLYKAVYVPRILYGANTWYPRIQHNCKIKKKLESAQRSALLAITGAYKTASTAALQVIAGVPPINLVIQMKIDVQNGIPKEEARQICLNSWQEAWTLSEKGRWTHSFIPDVRCRTVTPITFDHYICQIITGHGDFNQKLHGFNLAADPSCRCGYPNESAQHVIEDCSFGNNLRNQLRRRMEIEGFTWPYGNESYIRSFNTWQALKIFAKGFLTDKEEHRNNLNG